MAKLCMHIYVDGKVQGVWYRASAQQQAQSVGITGWAKNLSDGRVELIACGEQQTVEQFIEWLWQGPVGARVTTVDCKPTAMEDFLSFKVIR